TSINHGASSVIGRKHITLNATGGGFLTASKQFIQGATRKRRSNLFPYTTLFRSRRAIQVGRRAVDLDDAFTRGGGRVVVLDHHRSEEHTSELQSLRHLVCRLLLEKINSKHITLNATGGGFFTASKQFRHGATSKSRSNTASNSTKHKSPHLSGWRQIISLIT